MSIVSYAQNFEDVMLWRALGPLTPGFYIDVGAQDPVVDSVSLAFYERGWRGIHVEPTPYYAEQLRQQRIGDTVIQSAIGLGPAVLQFFEIPETGISTGDSIIAEQHRQRGFTIHEIAVPCIPLSAVFDIAQGQEIHWLKIDVEGLEKQVLTSWGAATARPWIVIIESTLPLTQVESYDDWDAIITSYGYGFVYFDGLNRFYVSDAHPELKKFFLAPPNVFDAFSLNGTASATFQDVIQTRFNERLSAANAELDVQKNHADLEINQLSAELEQIKKYYIEKEQELTKQLTFAQSDFAQFEQNQTRRQQLVVEQTNQLRSEIEQLLRTLVKREQDFAEEKIAIMVNSKEQEKLLQQQFFDREKEFAKQMQQLQQIQCQLNNEKAELRRESVQQERVLSQQLADLLRQQVTREQTIATDIQELQKKAAEEAAEIRRDVAEQLSSTQQRASSEIALLREAHVVSEIALNQQVANWQSAFLQLQRDMVQREVVAHAKLEALQIKLQDLQVFNNTREQEFSADLMRLVQLHANEKAVFEANVNAEKITKFNEYLSLQTLFEETKKQISAELAAERTISVQLQQTLSDVRHQLSTTETSYSWRLTAPFRKLKSFFLNEKLQNSVPDALCLSKAISLLQNTSCVTQSATLLPTSAISESTLFHPAFIEPAMPPFSQTTNAKDLVAATTLDELLLYHDQQFVHCAYLTLLGRIPDPEGLWYYTKRLRLGAFKIEILKQLKSSREGVAHNSHLPKLDIAIRRYKQQQLPLIGWLFSWFCGGGNQINRQLCAIENQIFILSEDSNRRLSQAELKLQALPILGGQISLLLESNNLRFDHLDTMLKGLKNFENQVCDSDGANKAQTQALQDELQDLMVELQIINNNSGNLIFAEDAPFVSTESDRINHLSRRGKEIYFQLKTAAAMHAEKVK